VFTTIVANLRRGLNEDEVGDLIRLSLETPRCTGVMLQPSFGSGRGAIDPLDRVTPTGVLRDLSRRTGGLLDWTDFIPLPCSHRDCCDLTYLIRAKDGKWRSLPKLLGREQLARWIHVIGNTVTFDEVTPSIAEMLRGGVLQRVFSNEPRVGALTLMRDIARMCSCVPGLPELLAGLPALAGGDEDRMDRLAERTRRISIKMFMDVHRLHAARIRQCCVHVGTFEAEPRRYPFCHRWLFADADDRPASADGGGA
jgi:7,8-dihydro-6-hydroxymethylpterin dimethyltransferase